MTSSISALLLPKGAAANRLALACAFAWISVAIIALAVVLQVIDATRSYAAAGAAAAAYGLAAAFIGVPRSRLVDLFGPRRTLPALAAVHVTCLVAMVGAGRLHAGGTVFVFLAALISGSTPPLIGFARGRWSHVVPASDLPRAYALTAMLGDLAQIVGAPAAGLLAVLLDPAAGLAVAAVFTTVGVVLLLGSPAVAGDSPTDTGGDDGRRTVQRHEPQRRRTMVGAIGFAGLRTITLGGVGVGLGLGAVDVAVPALATVRGERWATGLLLGALGVGGVVGSAVSPRLAGFAPGARYVTGLAVLLPGTLVLAFTPPALVVGAALLVVGFAWGVTNVVLYELLDIVVPTSRSTEAWAWLSTAEAIGAAAGAAVAGMVADRSLAAAFAIVPAAVAVGLLIGLAGRRRLVAPPPAAHTASLGAPDLVTDERTSKTGEACSGGV
jgi:MFS family permease